MCWQFGRFFRGLTVATLLYVHGIANRGADGPTTCKLLQTELTKRGRSNYKVIGCDWGDLHGAHLPVHAKSVPSPDYEHGPDSLPPDQSIAGAWASLQVDPLAQLIEMNAATHAPPPLSAAPHFSTTIDSTLVSLKAQASPDSSIGNDLATDLYEAHLILVSNTTYKQYCDQPSIDRVIAEALCRAMISLAYLRQSSSLGDSPSTGTLESLANSLAGRILTSEKAFGVSLVWPIIARLGTRILQSHRRQLTAALIPCVGDVLTYQTHGARLRDQIKNIASLPHEPPLVLLGHSLGGVACVDALCEDPIPNLSLLVTAGSQAGFFHELGILHSCPRTSVLPGHFPRWLNFYDLNDFLAYLAAPVFTHSQDIIDIKVASGKPFIESHSSYWFVRRFWDTLIPYLQ
jgi:hypothetical protein